VSFIFTGGFPPFLIFGLASNEDFGIGFVLGGLTAWLGWLLILTYFYPWNMFILLSIIIFVVVVVYLFNKIVP